ncbi:hypothetical protein NWE61_02400 [Mycoplasmopsis felis]|uniref:hypothetical protein n=1 Tax=Mycoplasmopsis felis TaxID=33923 RepID=UPI0021E071CC|nr:hypothetical protein [Mycoplasmopsis felis]MCU9934036.1 hypothetical protein [Mycoplasmopsis felis]
MVDNLSGCPVIVNFNVFLNGKLFAVLSVWGTNVLNSISETVIPWTASLFNLNTPVSFCLIWCIKISSNTSYFSVPIVLTLNESSSTDIMLCFVKTSLNWDLRLSKSFCNLSYALNNDVFVLLFELFNFSNLVIISLTLFAYLLSVNADTVC